MSHEELPHAMHYGPDEWGGWQGMVIVRAKNPAGPSQKEALTELRRRMAGTLGCKPERINFITPEGFVTNEPPTQ